MESKRIFKLSPRLEECARMVTTGTRIADIGTDHAYLPIWMAKMGIIKHAIACDINNKPLERAKENIVKYGVSNIISTRISNGLENIEECEVDEVVIAGMGGELIANIIDKTNWLKNGKKLILQPMSSDSDLRIYLSKSGYLIEKEKVVLSESRVYTVIMCKYDGKKREYHERYYFSGRIIDDDKDINEQTIMYLKKQIKDLENRKIGEIIRGNSKNVNRINQIINYFKGCINKGK